MSKFILVTGAAGFIGFHLCKQLIEDGYKVIVCKLKPNPMNMTSIAYPVDELQLPEWFKEMPFDDDTMEKTIVDQKVRNLLGVMDWKLDDAVENNNFGSLFDFN